MAMKKGPPMAGKNKGAGGPAAGFGSDTKAPPFGKSGGGKKVMAAKKGGKVR
jgi:hypothetical protein